MRDVSVLGATLSPAQMAFYSTAATVIPILALSSLVGMATLARTASQRLDRIGETLRTRLIRALQEDLAELRTARLGRSVVAVNLFLFNRAFGGIGQRLVAPLFLISIGLPVAGEISALATLARDHADHQALVITWLGLGASGIIVLAPALQTLILFYVPFAGAIGDALRAINLSEQQAHDVGSLVGGEAPDPSPPDLTNDG